MTMSILQSFKEQLQCRPLFGPFCQIEAGYRKPEHPIKACYLVPNPSVYGTLRMHQALAENHGVEVHVGYDIGELAEVLGVDAVQLGSEWGDR